MAVPIIPRVERGRLYFQTADISVLALILAAGALPAFVAKDGAR